MEHSVEIELTDKQQIGYEYLLDDKHEMVIYGGSAGSWKSVLWCFWLITQCLEHPWTSWVLARKTLKQLKVTTVEKSMMEVLNKFLEIPRDFYKYDERRNVIKFANGEDESDAFAGGSQIHLYPLEYKPSDPMYSELGSLEISGAFIDEWNNVPKTAADILLSRCRWKTREWNLLPPKVFITTNPDNTSWLYRSMYIPWSENRLNSESTKRERWDNYDYVFIQALPTDNPKIPPRYLELLRNAPEDKRKRLYEGKWEYQTDDKLLFHKKKISSLYVASPNVEDPERYISVDVARAGWDKTVIMVREGMQVRRIIDFTKDDVPYSYQDKLLQYTVSKLKELSRDLQIPRSHIVVDSDWVGWWVKDFLPWCRWFTNNASAIQPPIARYKRHLRENYSNLKTQCYYKLKEYIDNESISVACNSEQEQFISEELSIIRTKDKTMDAPIQLESKTRMREKLGRSPDYADALMMRMVFEVDKKNNSVTIL